MKQRHCVTGAFGYSGKYIASALLDAGHEVITLTNSPRRANPFGGAIRAYPFHFDNEMELTRSLDGVKTLYNTYWVRFNHRLFQQADAVNNTKMLFRAAQAAGVQRIVHVSITNPSLASELEYFRSKAILEDALASSSVPHSILRPAVLFGREDVLVNNIAWALRRLPVFGVFGAGEYRLQPIHVDDFARLAVVEGEATGLRVVDAIGPETFTYRELVAAIMHCIGVHRRIISVPPSLGLLAGKLIGWWHGDVFLTRDEVEGLMQDLLYVAAPPTGSTRLTEWAHRHRDELGQHYSSELERRRNRESDYGGLKI